MTRTVKVRVAVAVDSEGWWSARGWLVPGHLSRDGAEESMRYVVEASVGPDSVVHWLTADLPIPEPAEVEATVRRPASASAPTSPPSRPSGRPGR